MYKTNIMSQETKIISDITSKNRKIIEDDLYLSKKRYYK